METKPTLRKWLTLIGLSTDAFAKVAGVSRQTISSILNDKHKITLDTALHIWRATDHEVCLCSLYPMLDKMLPTIKKISDEDACKSV